METGKKVEMKGINTSPFVVKPSKRKKLAKQAQQSAVAAADGAGDKVAALMRLGISPHAINKVVGAATINIGPVMDATLQQMANELRGKSDKYEADVADFTELTATATSMIKDARTTPADAIEKLSNERLKLLVKFLSLEKGLVGARPTTKKLMQQLIDSYDADEWDEMLQSPTYLDRLIKPNIDAADIIAECPTPAPLPPPPSPLPLPLQPPPRLPPPPPR